MGVKYFDLFDASAEAWIIWGRWNVARVKLICVSSSLCLVRFFAFVFVELDTQVPLVGYYSSRIVHLMVLSWCLGVCFLPCLQTGAEDERDFVHNKVCVIPQRKHNRGEVDVPVYITDGLILNYVYGWYCSFKLWATRIWVVWLSCIRLLQPEVTRYY